MMIKSQQKPMDVSSYRPNSLLLNISKVLEKLKRKGNNKNVKPARLVPPLI